MRPLALAFPARSVFLQESETQKQARVSVLSSQDALHHKSGPQAAAVANALSSKLARLAKLGIQRHVSVNAFQIT